MPIPTVAYVLGGAGLAFAIGYAFMKSQGTKIPTGTAAELGAKDGCAKGTADGKAGSLLLEPTNTDDDPALAKAAKDSGDPLAYFSAYGKSYDECGKKALPAPATPTTPTTPVKVKPPPGVKPGAPPTVLERDVLAKAYSDGCSKGAADGYTAGFNGRSMSFDLSGASGSGNPDAWRAAYKKAFSEAYSNGKSDAASGRGAPGGMVIDKPTETVLASDNLELRTLGVSLACGAGFSVWLGSYVATTGAKVAGSSSIGRMFSNVARVGRRTPVHYKSRHLGPDASALVGYSAAQKKALNCLGKIGLITDPTGSIVVTPASPSPGTSAAPLSSGWQPATDALSKLIAIAKSAVRHDQVESLLWTPPAGTTDPHDPWKAASLVDAGLTLKIHDCLTQYLTDKTLLAGASVAWSESESESMGGGPNRHPSWPAPPKGKKTKVYRAYPEPAEVV
jgi:hypothetical protein